MQASAANPATCRRGFTLLEVLVALIIFSVASASIASLFQTALRQSIRTSDRLEALALAENQITRIGAEFPLEPGEMEGVVLTPGGRVLTWRSRIVLAEPVYAPENLALYRINVDVVENDNLHALIALKTFRVGRVQ